MLKDWVLDQGITISYIEPGNPQQNSYVERYNRTMHYDWLNQELFTDLDQVRKQLLVISLQSRAPGHGQWRL